MITDIEDYFSQGCGRCERFATPDCSARRWIGGLAQLRRICLAAGLEETVKWGHPCYAHAGRNVALIGALRGGFRLGFMNAALMTDPHGVLERQGPNTAHPDVIRFTDEGQVADLEPVIAAYLEEAKGYAAAGLEPPKVERDLDLPVEFADALASDPGLAEAFDGLTPGRRRSWALFLGGAKTSATRVARIARSREAILAGKGATER